MLSEKDIKDICDELEIQFKATPKKQKKPKYWPIETAPINEDILVWDCYIYIWKYWRFGHADHRTTYTNHTHWRHQPKGPKSD